ncbi:hypothetical protein N431DRAFT_541927 [Stipitochalara longipes BDJ]|nr:hypothetical protein N431DRAFT_541927 [Stipitochalara longipes BDJ]
MSQGYSDLQVVHDPDQPGLEYSPPAQGHNGGAQYDQTESKYKTSSLPNYHDAPQISDNYGGNAPLPAPPRSSKRICGLAARTFWIVAGVIGILVVAAAVGGGVGGALGSKSKNTKNAASTPTAQGASTSSSSPPSSPSSDCPSSNNTLYTVNVGQEMSFRKICGSAYLNAINGGDVVNLRTLSLDDCIVECATYNFQNKTAIAAGKNNVCNSVCQCFGFTTQNSSSTFVVHNETICDSAAWIDQNI